MRPLRYYLLLFLLACLPVMAGEYRVAKLNRVVDGDTIRCDIYLGLDVMLLDKSVRLAGIDTAELNPDKLDANKQPREAHDIENERTRAVAAQEYLTQLLDGKKLIIRTNDKDEWESYGRVLANLFIVGEDGNLTSVAALLVAAGHAREWER